MLTPRHILTLGTVTLAWVAFSFVASTPTDSASETRHGAAPVQPKPAVHVSVASRTDNTPIPAPLGPFFLEIPSASASEVNEPTDTVADAIQSGTGVADPPPEILMSAQESDGLAAVQVVVPPADLSLRVGSLPTLGLGESGIIELIVTNDGPSEAGAAEIVYFLPVGVDFASTMANPNTCATAERQVLCSIAGVLPAGASAVLQIPITLAVVPEDGQPIVDGEASVIRSAVPDLNTTNDTLGVAPLLR